MKSRTVRNAGRALLQGLARLLSPEASRRYESVRCFCAFAGQRRSGHSFIGAMLNAHPRACLALEADAFGMVERGFRRDELYTALVLHAHFVSAVLGNRSAGYDYTAGGGGQGRHERLEVVGDNMGARTLMRLHADPGLAGELESRTGVPLKLIHVVRNPFDSITTMHNRSRGARPDPATGRPMLRRRLLERKAEAYLERARWMLELRRRQELQILDVWQEDYLADPVTGLRRITDFLGLGAEERYYRRCAAVTLSEPRRTRFSLPWPDRLVARVEEESGAIDFLARYRFAE